VLIYKEDIAIYLLAEAKNTKPNKANLRHIVVLAGLVWQSWFNTLSSKKEVYKEEFA